MSDKPTWQIRLGENEWMRFTYARPVGDPIRLLGSVRKGMQMGALAVTWQGQFIAVNGDYITPLNHGQIQRVLDGMKAHAMYQLRRNQRMVIPPRVEIKRRRNYQYGASV